MSNSSLGCFFPKELTWVFRYSPLVFFASIGLKLTYIRTSCKCWLKRDVNTFYSSVFSLVTEILLPFCWKIFIDVFKVISISYLKRPFTAFWALDGFGPSRSSSKQVHGFSCCKKRGTTLRHRSCRPPRRANLRFIFQVKKYFRHFRSTQ